MNKYRVDQAQEAYWPPCGMNSVRYLGDSIEDATLVFHHAKGGVDAWGAPDRDYGVMLSIWHPNRQEYVVKRWKSK